MHAILKATQEGPFFVAPSPALPRYIATRWQRTFHASEPRDRRGTHFMASRVPATVPTEPTANTISRRPVEPSTRLQPAFSCYMTWSRPSMNYLDSRTQRRAVIFIRGTAHGLTDSQRSPMGIKGQGEYSSI